MAEQRAACERRTTFRMQQELWLQAKLQVLASLKPIRAMRAASTDRANSASPEDGTVRAQERKGGGDSAPVGTDAPISPSKPANPVKSSRTHQELHKELLLAHRKGLGVSSKPELQVVLEKRRREQTQREEGELGRSPLEAELFKRQQRQQEMERQQEKGLEGSQPPEFVKVRQNLRKTHPITPCTGSS
ncbi:protein FAM107B isoform X2 [Amia ocellicauda]|uniref:protein FAM107B isoform X2 n=1 Tax=Amia ocellicauda TaxID=2972642 RepID=UPI0034640EB5